MNATESSALFLAVERILSIPDEIDKLRTEVAKLRAEVDLLRRSQPPALCTIQTAASRLGVSTKTVRRYIESGKLRSVRVGEVTRVDLSSVAEAFDISRERVKPRVEAKTFTSEGFVPKEVGPFIRPTQPAVIPDAVFEANKHSDHLGVEQTTQDNGDGEPFSFDEEDDN